MIYWIMPLALRQAISNWFCLEIIVGIRLTLWSACILRQNLLRVPLVGFKIPASLQAMIVESRRGMVDACLQTARKKIPISSRLRTRTRALNSVPGVWGFLWLHQNGMWKSAFLIGPFVSHDLNTQFWLVRAILSLYYYLSHKLELNFLFFVILHRWI